MSVHISTSFLSLSQTTSSFYFNCVETFFIYCFKETYFFIFKSSIYYRELFHLSGLLHFFDSFLLDFLNRFLHSLRDDLSDCFYPPVYPGLKPYQLHCYRNVIHKLSGFLFKHKLHSVVTIGVF